MLEFIDGSTLHFIEFVETSEGEEVKRLNPKLLIPNPKTITILNPLHKNP